MYGWAAKFTVGAAAVAVLLSITVVPSASRRSITKLSSVVHVRPVNDFVACRTTLLGIILFFVLVKIASEVVFFKIVPVSPLFSEIK